MTTPTPRPDFVSGPVFLHPDTEHMEFGPPVISMGDVHHGTVNISINMRGVAVFDIDGTLADITHRRAHIEADRKNWAAFERDMDKDLPVPAVVGAAQTLAANGWIVLIATGRGAQNREVTEAWLKAHKVPYDALYMRNEFIPGEVTKKGKPRRDYRKDNIVKAEMLEIITAVFGRPDIVFDDRNQVVDMWRENGIPCVQVAEGDF